MRISEAEAIENLKELFLETGVLQRILEDPSIGRELRAEGEAVGIAKGEAAGIVRGKAEGEVVGIAKGHAEAVRQMTLSILTHRFGEVPEALAERIAAADSDDYQRLFDRAITATSLSELTDTL